MSNKGKKNKKRNPLKIIIPVVFILAGLAIASFPIIGRYQSQIKANAVIDSYNQTITNMSSEERQVLKDKADKYNATGNTEYYVTINPEGVLGYIEIPSIDVYLPVYDNTEAETLDVGIGHVIETSLPVGGNGTHCLLTGHSGLTTQKMFTDLTELTEGDKFYLYVLGDTLSYQVYDTEEVLPSEVNDSIKYDDNKDLCTLMTCTPIGVNTHRLLVHARRVENAQDEDNDADVTENTLTRGNKEQENTSIKDKSTLVDRESDKVIEVTCCIICGVITLFAIIVIITRIVRASKARKQTKGEN